jgi:putative transposase
MPSPARVQTLAEAYTVIKGMQLRGWEWGEAPREAARAALVRVLEERMACYLDERLAEVSDEQPDRRNGGWTRHLLTELGDVVVRVPRSRRTSAVAVIEAYRRRGEAVDRAVLACFVLGLSTRKVAEGLMPFLGEPLSASTVSRVARTLDTAVAAFHRRKLRPDYRVLLLDGVVLARKTGAGAVRRPVLVALGLRPDGKKEVIDYRFAASESQAEWELFLTDLYRRGLTEDSLELIVVDGGGGLLRALDTVYPNVPRQRCWAHKARNLTDKVRRDDRASLKRGLRKIYDAPSVKSARSAARRLADRWCRRYPRVVASLQQDLDDLLAFFCFRDPAWRRATRTTNAIERRFREVRRRTRPMGVFSDRTSLDRILFAVFSYENRRQGISPLFLVTQNS